MSITSGYKSYDNYITDANGNHQKASYTTLATDVMYDDNTNIKTKVDGKLGSAAIGTVTTGAAGSSAAVTVTNSGNTATFNFTIPKGATGGTGGKGDTGTRGSLWYSGTGITGTSTTATIFSGSGVSSALVNDMYLNTSTGNVYKCTVAGAASVAKWVYSGSIKGATGGTGATGTSVSSITQTTTSSADGGTNVITATLSNGTTSTFNIKNGSKGSTGGTGATGTRGSRWNTGTAMTGTSTSNTQFTGSGITDALVNDMYLNTSTSYVYRCTVAGNATNARWVYVGSIKGNPGQNATTTAVATTSANGLMSSSDKTKLNGIAEGANKTVIDTALSADSKNPVSNMAITNKINELNSNINELTLLWWGGALTTGDYTITDTNKSFTSYKKLIVVMYLEDTPATRVKSETIYPEQYSFQTMITMPADNNINYYVAARVIFSDKKMTVTSFIKSGFGTNAYIARVYGCNTV